MFAALLKTRLAALFSYLFRSSRSKKKRGPLFKVLIGAFVVYILGCFFYMFGAMFWSICQPLCQMQLDWLYFALVCLMAVSVGFIFGIFMVQSQLFEARDNELLLAMPITPAYILGSRMSMLLLLNYLYELFVAVPAVVIYYFSRAFSITSLLYILAALLLLPFLTLTLSCIGGWLIAAVSSRMRRKNIVTTIVSLAVLLGYFAVYSKLQDYLNLLLSNGASIAASIRQTMYPVYCFGVAAVEQDPLSLLLFALCALLPFACVYWVLSRSFIRIATAQKGTAKIRYKEAALKVSSSRMALMKKDLRHLASSSMYMMNGALGVVFLIILAGFVLFKADYVTGLLAALPGAESYLGALLCLALCGVCSMNIISAPSISLEGKSLWLLQSCPIDPGDALLAKAYAHMVVCLPAVILAAAACVFKFSMPLLSAVLVFLVPMLFTAFTALFGVFINLKFPRFDWISETAAVKQSMSTMLAMFGSMAVMLVPALVYGLFLADLLAPDTFLAICCLVLLAAVFGLRRYLTTRGKEIFMTLG